MAAQRNCVLHTYRDIVCSWDRMVCGTGRGEEIQSNFRSSRKRESSRKGAIMDRAGAVLTSLLCSLQTDLLARAGGLDEPVDWNW